MAAKANPATTAPTATTAPLTPAATGAAGVTVRIDPAVLSLSRNIDGMVREHHRYIAQAVGMEKAMLTASIVKTLRDMITPRILEHILPLMNSPNGFKTDKPGEGYPPDVVKECLVTSLVNGMYPVNNEWNIIAGQFYGALNGWKRLFEEIPGITDISVVPGMPQQEGEIARCRVAVSWRLNGVAGCLTDPEGKPGPVFVVHQRGGRVSPDQVIGKAKRKAYKMAYEKVTGSVTTGEADDGVAVTTADEARPALPAGSSNRLAARILPATPEEARRRATEEDARAKDLQEDEAMRRAEEEAMQSEGAE
jgi:hypothetical protein